MLAKGLEAGLGLKREHQKILIRTGWVLFVTYHIARAAGWLAPLGLASMFASASDVDKLIRASEINARISMQNEIRVQTRNYCETDDVEIRASALKRIDQLREDMWEIAKVRVPEPQCMRGHVIE